jgi:hypothetical protein
LYRTTFNGKNFIENVFGLENSGKSISKKTLFDKPGVVVHDCTQEAEAGESRA